MDTSWPTCAAAAWSTALGARSAATGDNGTALGSSTVASALNATAAGFKAAAAAESASALGHLANASAPYSVAIGAASVGVGRQIAALATRITALENAG